MQVETAWIETQTTCSSIPSTKMISCLRGDLPTSQAGEGTKSIHSWQLWPIIHLCKSKQTLLATLKRKRLSSAVMENFKELKKLLRCLLSKRTWVPFQFYWQHDLLFSTTFSMNEHEIKQESSTYKKRPQGQ